MFGYEAYEFLECPTMHSTQLAVVKDRQHLGIVFCCSWKRRKKQSKYNLYCDCVFVLGANIAILYTHCWMWLGYTE